MATKRRCKPAEFLIGLLCALALVGISLGVLFLSGCSNGVQLTEEETVACRNEGCIALTERDVRALLEHAAKAGYRKGWADALKQTGRGA